MGKCLSSDWVLIMVTENVAKFIYIGFTFMILFVFAWHILFSSNMYITMH